MAAIRISPFAGQDKADAAREKGPKLNAAEPRALLMISTDVTDMSRNGISQIRFYRCDG
jgi:hypothetical protein